jgi:hypothetical protein
LADVIVVTARAGTAAASTAVPATSAAIERLMERVPSLRN